MTSNLTDRVRLALELGESQFREFKSALQGPPAAKKPRVTRDICRDIGEALVAFANAEGGELMIGVEDDSTITGVPHSESDLERLVKAPVTHVLTETPLPTPTISRIVVDGHLVLYFYVEKSTRFVHQTSDGRCVQRKDVETRPISSENIRLERSEETSREYDRRFVDGASIADLDSNLITSVKNNITPGRSIESFLALMRLMDFTNDGVRLRRAALLLFAKEIQDWHPRCEVRIFRVRGTELGVGKKYNVDARPPIVSGSIFRLLSEAWEQLRPFLVETKFGAEGRFDERILYPEDACLEALTNAIAHRDYSDEGRAIEIFIFDDRLEVRSPGALLSNITVEDLVQLKGVHQSRNAYVARVLREAGYMREMGEGLRRIYQLMSAHDLVEPTLSTDHASFAITMQHKSIFSRDAQDWLDAYEKFSLSREEARVVLLGKNGQAFSAQQIIDSLNIVDTEHYRSIVEKLQWKGMLITAMASGQVSSYARRHRLDSRRLVPKYKTRSPEECENWLSEYLRAMISTYQGGLINASVAKKAQELLSSGNPYKRPLTGGYLASLTSLGLIDASGAPSGRLKSLISSTGGSDGHRNELLESSAPLTNSPEPLKSSSSLDADPVNDLDGYEGPPVLFIGNIPFDLKESDLYVAMQDVPGIASISLGRNFSDDARNRGFAHIRFWSIEKAQDAFEVISQKLLKERRLAVEWARQKS